MGSFKSVLNSSYARAHLSFSGVACFKKQKFIVLPAVLGMCRKNVNGFSSPDGFLLDLNLLSCVEIHSRTIDSHDDVDDDDDDVFALSIISLFSFVVLLSVDDDIRINHLRY